MSVSKKNATFAEKFRTMNKENLKNLLAIGRKYLFNKYVIVLAVFAIPLCFVGSASLLSRIRNMHEISERKNQLREYQEMIDATNRDILSLENPDSLERFAREHYHMHADNEDVYLIKE